MNGIDSGGSPAGRRRPAKDIDEYLASVPEPQRAVLEKLRRTIRAAAPNATERISYGIPAFCDPGPLVGFGAFKDHGSFFPMSVATMSKFESELGPYDAAKGTIRFTADRPLPAALVRRIVLARVKENGERRRERQIRKRRRERQIRKRRRARKRDRARSLLPPTASDINPFSNTIQRR